LKESNKEKGERLSRERKRESRGKILRGEKEK